MQSNRSVLSFLAFLLATGFLAWSMTMASASGGSGSSVPNSGSSGSGSGSGSSNSDSVDVPDPTIEDTSSSQSGSGDDTPDSGDDNSGASDSSSGDSNSGSSSEDDSSGSGDSSDSTESTSSGDSGDGGDKSESSNSVSSDNSTTSGSSGTGSGDGDHDAVSSSASVSSGSRSTTQKNSSTSGQSATVSKVESQMEIAENEHGERFRKGEVVVMSSRDDMASLIAKDGLKVIESFKLASFGLKGFRVAVPSSNDEAKVLARLKRLDPKSIATLNNLYSPARGDAVALSPTAAKGNGTAKRTNARIGLVDARVDSKHPLLRQVSVSARMFGIASSTEDNHGTAVASLIAASAPGANIYAASVFSELQNGSEIASVDAIARGLDWLAHNNVPVINLSLTGPANPILQAVTERLIEKGHVLVAAVGNEGPHAPAQYPAAYPGVIGVTAVDSNNKVYLYANQGSYVEFAARGVDTKVATASGQVEIASGTSFAAPIVAVALARMMPQPDRELAKRAEEQLAKSARDLGEPGRDSVYGYGVIGPEAEQ